MQGDQAIVIKRTAPEVHRALTKLLSTQNTIVFMGSLMIGPPANSIEHLDLDLAFMCLLPPPQTHAFGPVHSAYLVQIHQCYERWT